MADPRRFFDDIGPMLCALYSFPVIFELKIEQSLLSGPKSIEELCSGSEFNLERVHRLMLQLESLEIFSFDPATQKWAHSERSMILTNPHMRTHLLFLSTRTMFEGFFQIKNVAKSHKNAYEIAGQGSLFECLKQRPEELDAFHLMMEEVTKWTIQPICEQINLTGIKNAIDVGAGNGTLSIALAKTYPEKQFSVFDQPHVAEIARKNISENGLAERIGVESGSFFEEIPKGYDGITLTHVLHNWNDEDVVRILKTCRNALEPGKKVFIIDILVGNGRKYTKYERSLDTMMMMLFSGMERTDGQILRLLEESGFRISTITNLKVDSIVEAEAI
jgi:tRNA A58 N-methylase Trm61